MAATGSPVTPSVLAWALDEDGRTREEVAEAVGVSAESLEAWAEGELQPTRGELSQLAKRLRRPRSLFFLPRPPTTASIPPSFRHASEKSSGKDRQKARRFIREVRRVQRTLSWVLQDAGEDKPHVPSIDRGEEIEEAATRVRNWIGLSVDEQTSWRDEYHAFRQWRRIVEARGIFALRLEIGAGNIRGFSMWNQYAPLIAVNASRYTPQSRIFTIGHELAHLVTRTDRSCTDSVDPSGETEWGNERWCEKFSAALLLPEDDVRSFVEQLYEQDMLAVARKVGRKYWVSLQASAVRLIELGIATRDLWAQVSALPASTRDSGGSGRPQSLRRLQEYGPQIPVILDDAVTRERIPLMDALDILNIQTDEYRRLIEISHEEIDAR